MEKEYYEIETEELNHLKNCDPVLKKLINEIKDIKRETISDPFTSLISAIVYQQLAYSAANSIWNKFIDKIKELTPTNILETSFDDLRETGLSKNKIDYIKNIASAFNTDEFKNIVWDELKDEQIIEKLIQIKGIGRWTAEMFLIFTLKRKNVFSYDDLGLRNGIKKLYKLDEIPTKEEMIKITKAYEPYKTIAALYIWELTSNKNLDINIDNLDYITFVNKLSVGFMHTKIGWLKLIGIDNKLAQIDFVNHPDFYILRVNKTIKESIKQLEEYFKNERKEFDLPLLLDGTEFQIKVWEKLQNIKYGKTISYQELAEEVDTKNSARAVGMANNKNKIPIIIPCHRVIGKNNNLTGYAGGLKIKEILIKHELEE